MKRWGVILAVALILLTGIKGVKAGDTECTLANGCLIYAPITDPVVCPDGCTIITVVNSVTPLGSIYTITGTSNPIPVPGGYDPAVMAAFSAAVTPSTDDVAVGGGVEITTGMLGVQYADGRYAGFYKAPNGKYFPITVTDKNAGRKAKYHPSDTYNCPSDQEPYFGTDAELGTQKRTPRSARPRSS